jgi:hypothetical protein
MAFCHAFAKRITKSTCPSGYGISSCIKHQIVKPLSLQVRHGRHRDVQAALDSGISPSVRDEFGNTLLIMAAQVRHK